MATWDLKYLQGRYNIKRAAAMAVALGPSLADSISASSMVLSQARWACLGQSDLLKSSGVGKQQTPKGAKPRLAVLL